MATTPQHDAARAYAARGWPVFPLVAKGKQPLTEHGLKDATTDPKRIDAWWTRHPNANVGLRTGVAFDVLDLDGEDAVARFRTWCGEHDIDPQALAVYVSRTGKGWHYLMRPCGVGNRARLLEAPIDWRGDGGYIVAPPSIHPTGAQYRWAVALNGTPLPAVPAALRDVLAPPVQARLAPTVPRTVVGEGDNAAWLRAGFEAELDRVKQAPEGARNQTLFTALCSVLELVNGGLPDTAVDDLCEAGRVIGLPDVEIERTLGSAMRKVGTTARTPPPTTTRPAARPAARTAPVPTPAPVEQDSAALQPAQAVYQGLAGEAVQALDAWTEADPVAVLASLLAGAGCAIGRTPHALVSATRHPVLVWPLLLGPTSTGRKGTAQDVAEALLSAADPQFVLGNITGGLSSGEGLIHAVRDAVLEGTTDPAKEPKVIDPGVEDKRRWVVETEFASVMARAKREGNSLSGVLRQAWDGKVLATLTKSSVVATGAHIAISAHVSPREFMSKLRDSELAGGTYNRFLPLLVNRSKLLPQAPPPPPELMSALGDSLRARITEARRVTRISRTAAAAALWDDQLYAEFAGGQQEDSERLARFTARAQPYCLRLSMLYALLDGRREVDVPHLEAAAALVRYSIASVRALLRTPEDAHLDRLVAALHEAGGRGLSRTEVNQLFAGKLTAPDLDDLLQRVPGLEAIEISTGGRPAKRYAIPAAEEVLTGPEGG